MTFKGLKVGVDTIKIANCSFRDGQECADYSTENTKLKTNL
jgi:predicted metal-binding protein